MKAQEERGDIHDPADRCRVCSFDRDRDPYASISDLSYKNTQIQTQNETLKDELDKIKMENALSQDLNSIQEKASTELGMYYQPMSRSSTLEP